MGYMRNKCLFILFFLCLTTHLCADSPRKRHEAGFSAGLASGYVYDFAFVYHYKLFPFVGFGGSVGLCRQWYVENSPSGQNAQGVRWWMDDAYEKISNVYVQPSISLETPSLRVRKEADLSLQVEPSLRLFIPLDVAVMLSAKFDDPHGRITDSRVTGRAEQWCSWGVKVAAKLRIDDAIVMLGCGVSDFDIYAPRRTMAFNGVSFNSFFPKKQLERSLFLRLSYCF